jgi:hypothetical protein
VSQIGCILYRQRLCSTCCLVLEAMLTNVLDRRWICCCAMFLFIIGKLVLGAWILLACRGVGLLQLGMVALWDAFIKHGCIYVKVAHGRPYPPGTDPRELGRIPWGRKHNFFCLHKTNEIFFLPFGLGRSGGYCYQL